MRLDPDCIRDILVVVEDNTDFSKVATTGDFIESGIVQKYNMNTIAYHIRKLMKPVYC